MALGLSFLGRGKAFAKILIGVSHICGAAAGGAIVGGVLGWIGMLLTLSHWRIEIIIGACILALWHGLSPHPIRLGLRRQVPRVWERTMTIGPRYFLWGVLLGSGIATRIYHASLLVLLGTQFTSGPVWGCLSGAIFGAAREAPALVSVLITRNGKELPIASLISNLEASVRRLNVAWIVVAALFLSLTSWLAR